MKIGIKDFKEKLLAIVGVIFSTLGLAGILGLCCNALTGWVFALFGGTSLVLFLLTYDWLFLLIGLFLLMVAILYFRRNKYGTCG